MRPSMLSLILILCLTPVLAPAAAAGDAWDMLQEQDFTTPIPTPTPLIKDLLGLADDFYGGHFEGAAPIFGNPGPVGVPPEVTYLTVDSLSGTYKTISGGVLCTVKWTYQSVEIDFENGTKFLWTSFSKSKTCVNGAVDNFVYVIGSALDWDPNYQEWSGWDLARQWDYVQPGSTKVLVRAPAGVTLDMSNGPSTAGPWFGPEFDEVDIAIGPGGTLDLRGHDGSGGPLFAPSGPVTLRCDTVLLDPGVVLTDLFAQAPVVQPGADARALLVLAQTAAAFDAPGVNQVQVRVRNQGNTPELVQLLWSDPLGWSQSVPLMVPLGPMETSQPIGLSVFIPPGTPVGTSSELQVQASTFGGLFEEIKVPLSLVDTYNPALVYCTAKVNSLGCTPQIQTTGNPTLSGYDDMHVLASDVLNGMVGLMFYGTGQASIPFQAGTLCVQGPVKRTPGQKAAGNPGAGTDCSGVFSYHLSHDFLEDIGMTPAGGMWCQYWSRDTAAPFGSGLSDAVELVFDP